MRTLTIFFEGSDPSGTNSLNYIDQILEFLDPSLGISQSARLVRLFYEIIRNIYDHADGKGQLYLKDDGQTISFEIKDYGSRAYDLEAIIAIGVSSKAGSGRNFGLGLIGGMIKGYANSLGIDLIIATSHGFCYSGVYRYKRSLNE